MESIEALVSKYSPLGIEKQKIISSFNRYVHEFSLPAAEAIRTLSHDYDKQLGIIDPEGNRTGEIEENFVKIGDLSRDMMDAPVRGQLMTVEIPKSQKLSYAGIIGDETGSIRFVFSKALKDIPDLISGKSYEFYGAQVSEYGGSLSLFLTGYSAVYEAAGPVDAPLFNPVDINDIRPGVVDLHAKITRLQTGGHEKIRYSGTLADQTGAARFIIWKNDSNESFILEEGKPYDISFASASFRNDQVNIDLTGATIRQSTEDIINPADDRATITGDITRIRATEPVYRCPECRRITKIEREGYKCETHGIVIPNKEYRVKCRLDNGRDAWSTILNMPAILELFQWTREQLFEFRDNDPLGDRAIEYEVFDRLFGRRVTLKGFLIDGRMIAEGLSLAYPQAAVKVSEQQAVI
jgi:ssDNA-binding replication factor A large subunit